jgi:hypothetical protein
VVGLAFTKADVIGELLELGIAVKAYYLNYDHEE